MCENIGGWKAARLVGVRYRTLDSWIRTGLLTVEGPADGPGTRRSFSFLDLLRARTVAELRRQGVSLQAIRKAQAYLTQVWGEADPLGQGRRLVLADNGALMWAVDDRTLMEIVTGQLANRTFMVLPVGMWAAEVREQIEALAA